MNNLNEIFLQLINASNIDKEIIRDYLKDKEIDDLLLDYKALELEGKTMEQIESIITIIKNYY